MYKQKNKTRLGKPKSTFNWIKRKVILIGTAFLIGMSNVIQEEDKTMFGNQNHIEQKQEKD